MKLLVKVKIPVERGNQKVKDGSLSSTLGEIMARQKPEAVYFTDIDGQRAVLTIVNVNDSSEISLIAEPYYLGFNASVEIHTILTPDDIGKAGGQFAELVAKFA